MPNPLASSTRRRLFLACLLLVAVAAVGLIAEPNASAIGIAGPSFCRFYSDATYTTVVGTRSVGCCGGVTTTGTQTQFARCERLYCPAVVCPD
jgi:hypothetical protein